MSVAGPQGNGRVNVAGATIELPTDFQGLYQPSADSTTTALTGGSTYTGGAFDLTDARGIIGSIYADQTGSLQVQQSPDGTHWDIVSTIAYNGTSKGLPFRIPVLVPGTAQGRLVYTNGSTTQTTFRLYAWTTPLEVRGAPQDTSLLATGGFSITPGSTTFAPTKAIEATTAAGTAAVTFADGTTATVYLVLGIPKSISVTNVASSGTTATGIVGYY